LFDIGILDAKIVDGNRAPWYMGDIGITDGRLSRIGHIDESECLRTIHADGRVLAPGFIDVHSHYDSVIFSDPVLLSVIRQGVTTVISGQCGDSRAPLRNDMIADFAKFSAAGSGGAEIPYNWRSFHDFLSIVDNMRLGVNMGSLVGHSTIRRCVLGVENRAPTPSELEDMKELLDSSLQEGGLGFSTGLVYAPGVYAETSELIELAKLLRKYNAPYMTHLRSESNFFIEAVEEALIIAKEAKVACHLAHHKALGKSNWHKVEASLKLVEEARISGLDITLDLYPYVLSTSMLRSILPAWVEEGGIDVMVQRLNNPEIRAKIINEIETSTGANNVWKDAGGPEGVIIMDTRLTHQYEGKNMVEASAISGKSPLETALDIIAINKGWDTACYRTGLEDNIRRIISKPYAMIGSDAVPCAPNAKCNPRTNGTFPRVISKYYREEGVLTLEDAIAKMTGLPATRLNLQNKGLIREKLDADLVLFDEFKIRDKADLNNPKAAPEGIDWVLIRGIPVLENGYFTEQRVGKVLYRT
jgi:N-acyl-D-amino-acid deacylase